MNEVYSQFLLVKDTLENMDLFLMEIEQTLDILESNPDDEARAACELKLAQLQQHLIVMNNALQNQDYEKTVVMKGSICQKN